MEPTNQKETGQEVAKLSQVIQIDEGKIQAHLGEVVRSTVEETLNAMLDAEADRLCRAERYQRTEARQDTRAGSYQRQLHTKVGDVRLKIPKLRSLPFETAIIERYHKHALTLVRNHRCPTATNRSDSFPSKQMPRAFSGFSLDPGRDEEAADPDPK